MVIELFHPDLIFPDCEPNDNDESEEEIKEIIVFDE